MEERSASTSSSYLRRVTEEWILALNSRANSGEVKTAVESDLIRRKKDSPETRFNIIQRRKTQVARISMIQLEKTPEPKSSMCVTM